MASQDTTDAVYLYTVAANPQFQQRCWLRYLISAFGVTAEAITAPATAVAAAGTATLTFAPATPANIVGLFVRSLSLHNPVAPATALLNPIQIGAKVASVTATTAVLDHNIIADGVAIGDVMEFAPAFHADRVRLAGAIFAKTVDMQMLASTILADATNRTNCLADKTAPGGNITDAGIDAQIALIFTGLSRMRAW